MTSARSSDLFCLKKMFFFVYQFSFNDLGAKRRDFFPPFYLLCFFIFNFTLPFFFCPLWRRICACVFVFVFILPVRFLKTKNEKQQTPVYRYRFLFFSVFLFPHPSLPTFNFLFPFSARSLVFCFWFS